MDALDRNALELVAAREQGFDRYRALRLLHGPQAPAPADWGADQTAEGGWRSRERKTSGPSMGRTSIVLMTMNVAGLMTTPEARRTVDFLWQTQQPDGRWGENPAHTGANPPVWNRPGDVTVEIWETANIAAGLAAAGFAHDQRIDAALAWLNGRVDDGGRFPGYVHGTFAMAALHALRTDHAAAERYLNASVAILRESHAEAWFDVMDLTWALMLWAMAGVSVGHPAVQAFLCALDERRLADGTWPTRYAGFGPSFLLEALEVRYLHGYAISAASGRLQ